MLVKKLPQDMILLRQSGGPFLWIHDFATPLHSGFALYKGLIVTLQKY
jgi:hypothetical protein